MIGEIVDFLLRMSMSNSQMLRNADFLRQDLKDDKSELIPFSHGEMELLSMSAVIKKKNRGFFKSYRGLFRTIYFEPLVAFSVKTYSQNYKLIMITTSDREIIYFVKNGKTFVFFNGKQLGILEDRRKLFNSRNQVIANIDGLNNIPTHAAFVMGRDVGFIANPTFEKKRENQRAFQMVKDMNDDERSIFLCLTMLNLIEA